MCVEVRDPRCVMTESGKISEKQLKKKKKLKTIVALGLANE